jgi:Pectate lyase superfamily protein
METIWLSPTGYVTGDPTLQISYPFVSHPGTVVTCTATGDLKWVAMGLRLPPNAKIEDVIISYAVSSAQSFISQIRLAEMTTPDHATVLHDDPTPLQSTSPASYASHVGGLHAEGAVTLELRLHFQNTGDEIRLGALGVTFQPPAECCVNSIAVLKELDAGVVSCLTVLGYYAPGDGGGGQFFWDSSFDVDVNLWPEGEDGGIVIRPSGLQPSQAGRWRRMFRGPVSVKWFGAKGDGDNDTLAIQKAVDFAVKLVMNPTQGTGVVEFPKGLYRVTNGFTIPAAITLMGQGGPPGGTENFPNNFPTILHDFDGDLFTFDGNTTSVGFSSGGGVERLRIVQVFGSAGDPGRGSAIVITGSDRDHRPSWTKPRLLIIEESGNAPWTWAIRVDGSNCGGIPDLYIGEISTHTSYSAGGALELVAASGPLIYNCAFYINGNISITGSNGVQSLSCLLMNVNAVNLAIDDAGDTTVIGGIYTQITNTFLTSGLTFLMPGRLVTEFAGVATNSTGVFYYKNVGGPANLGASFRFSQPIALENSQALWGLATQGQQAVPLIAVDVNNALRISPDGGVIVGIGDLRTLGAAVAGDVVLREGTAVRIENNSRDATPRILSIDGANRLELGMDADDIKWGKPVVPLGPLGVAMLGTTGGSGPTQAAQSGWLRGVDTDGNPFFVPIWR